MHPLWNKEVSSRRRRRRRIQAGVEGLNPSDAQARCSRDASGGCMQTHNASSHRATAERIKSSLPVNGATDHDADGSDGRRNTVQYVWASHFATSNQREWCRQHWCVTKACFFSLSSLFWGCSLIFTEGGRCALQPSVLEQSILKHRFVWVCVSAQPAWGQWPVPALLSPPPPSKWK